MADIGLHRNAIQTRLATIDGLHAYDVATGAERWPCAIVFPKPPRSGYFKTSNCGETLEYIVEIHIGLAQGLGRAQDQLDPLVSSGAGSVQAAILADTTLGATVNTTSVMAFTVYRLAKLHDADTLMAQIPVLIET